MRTAPACPAPADVLPPQRERVDAALDPLRHPFPFAPRGLKVGLLGGSFDPPHEGHIHITRRALKAFALDRIWWLVSPGNPLKARGPAALERRIAAARALIDHPRVTVTGIEARLGTRYTAQTLARLRQRYAGVHFLWLMGADNLAQFHRWQRWQEIMQTVPIGVLARPGAQLAAGLSPAARRFARFRHGPGEASGLVLEPPPAWILLTGPMHDVSSTAIRRSGRWPGPAGAE
ncbi:MAG: nicotinate-nucleotide adenylyltransferase [Alphaproteobacteria bacterium]|nr:MAG: nicotinate-nucleotide adenylyltransferase [Alphaproteobacteria bacterium]